MYRQFIVLLIGSVFIFTNGIAAPYVFDYTDNCNTAYHQYLSLHFDEGRTSIIREIKANPYNLMATFLSDYEDFIVLMLNCDKEDFGQRKGHLDVRISLLNNGDKASPWYRFCKAGVYLHWTIVYLRFGEHLKAANTFRKSYSLLKENRQLFPAFEYNMIFAGLEEAVVGSLPGNYKWLASIMGIKGSIKTGTAKLESFINTHNDRQPLYLETELYYQYTRFYFLAQRKEVWEITNSSQFPVEDNLMNAYFKVYLGVDYNKSDDVIKTINQVSRNKDYEKYPFLNFQMGMALLTNLDSSCIGYFNAYLKKNKGDAHVKDAWIKMSYYWYIAGKQEYANYCREQISKYGSTELDVDKAANKFAEGKTWPNSKLLQARLLLDGGYYTRAFTVLSSIDQSYLTNPADKAEYYYRLGRVYEESGENSRALEYFQLAIKAGKGRREQFAARAALHKGRVYELAGNKKMALSSYNETLDMPDHDFQNSIDQQAKAGINRLEDKL